MILNALETLLFYTVVYVLAFDDSAESSNLPELIEQGRTQYQLLREKGNLPRYGTCWKGAIEHVEEGCKNLSEESQSDMALHLTNCFLDMSGHPTYNCELDKKPNLRGICISSMSDRAFNVYTEFYTHVQSICWFLRGQIWYETISESSFKVGKQLEMSAKNQEELLRTQKESLEIQSIILEHERMLEKVLDDLYISASAHKEILGVLTKSVASFQTWVVGEISLFESIVFYFVLVIFILVSTSLKRTAKARLPLLLVMVSNFLLERFISDVLISEDSIFNTQILYQNVYTYIWYCRYVFIFIILSYLIYQSIKYKDILLENNKFLHTISVQNIQILDLLKVINSSCVRQGTPNSEFSCVNENAPSNGFLKKSFEIHNTDLSTLRDRRSKSRSYIQLIETHNRYNLRSSKQNTPEPH